MSNYLLADLLSCLKNYRSKDNGTSFKFPFSKFCESVLITLKSKGYIADYTIQEGESPSQKSFIVYPRFNQQNQNMFFEYKLYSKPSIRIYWTYRTLDKEVTSKRTRTYVLSTSQGVMSSDIALQRKSVAHYYLLYIN